MTINGGFVFRLSSVSYLLLHQHYTVLTTTDLNKVLKLYVSPPTLFFRDCFSYPLKFHIPWTSLWILTSACHFFFFKESNWGFDGDFADSVDKFEATFCFFYLTVHSGHQSVIIYTDISRSLSPLCSTVLYGCHLPTQTFCTEGYSFCYYWWCNSENLFVSVFLYFG